MAKLRRPRVTPEGNANGWDHNKGIAWRRRYAALRNEGLNHGNVKGILFKEFGGPSDGTMDTWTAPVRYGWQGANDWVAGKRLAPTWDSDALPATVPHTNGLAEAQATVPVPTPPIAATAVVAAGTAPAQTRWQCFQLLIAGDTLVVGKAIVDLLECATTTPQLQVGRHRLVDAE
jgi:hypothetical protein